MLGCSCDKNKDKEVTFEDLSQNYCQQAMIGLGISIQSEDEFLEIDTDGNGKVDGFETAAYLSGKGMESKIIGYIFPNLKSYFYNCQNSIS